MLLIRPIGTGQASYYLGGPPGRWLGGGCEELALAGPVTPRALGAVLRGHHPGGDQLLRRIPVRRRAGFDLIFAAPKSASLLAALAERQVSPDVATAIHAAHAAAVDDGLGYLQRCALWTRRGADHRRIATTGLVAAAFTHDHSWAADPHLHTHAVLANLVQGQDGRWSCLDGRSLYRHRDAAGAVYQAALRHHLSRAGLSFEWVPGEGWWRDVAGVPRTAIEACSTRRRQILEDVGEVPTAKSQRAAAGRTRRLSWPVGAPWPERVAVAGLDGPTVRALIAAARAAEGRRAWAPPVLMEVERALSNTTSSFTHADCVRVAAGQLDGGGRAADVEAWATSFLADCLPVGGDRWITATQRRWQDQLTALSERAWDGAGLARAESVQRTLADRPWLHPDARTAIECLTTSGAGIACLGRGSLVAQALVLESASQAWTDSGHRVAVISRSPRANQQWRVLAGLRPPPGAPAHATVMIVDGADRLPTAALHRLVSDAQARRAKLVLVDGGTLPARRWAHSPTMATWRDTLTPIIPGPNPWPSVIPERAPSLVRAGRDGNVVVAPTGYQAMAALVAGWARAWSATATSALDPTGLPTPVMVALGPDEAAALNDAAHRTLAEHGHLRGPAVVAGRHEWRTGDQIRILRRDGRLGPVPARTVGTVVTVEPRRDLVTIRWPAGLSTVSSATLGAAPVTYAYATTPAYLRGGGHGAILALGDPGPTLDAANIYIVAPPSPAPDMSHGPAARLLAERDGVTRPSPIDADLPLSELGQRRDELSDGLVARAPPDVRPELRRIREQRAWQDASGRPVGRLDERIQALEAAQQLRQTWVEAHRDQLEQWDGLSAAVAHRREALGAAAEIRPSRAVTAHLGPIPAAEAGRLAWRDAAGAIEAYRDRWGIPDDHAALDLTTAARAPRPAQRAEQLRVLAACRAANTLHRTRESHRQLTPMSR